MQNNTRELLPIGFYDILSPHAQGEFIITCQLLNQFVKFGYEQIKPTMIEFENGNQHLLKNKKSPQHFLVMDPHSKEMIKIRSDMTMQIARIANMRLSKIARPLRLSYTGQVLRATGSGLNAERQVTQTGLELIGSTDLKNSVIEVISIALSSLGQLGLENLSIDFNMAGLTEDILKTSDIPENQYQTILNLVESKDISALSKIAANQTYFKEIELLIALISSAGSADKALKSLININLPIATKEIIGHLVAINNFIIKNFPEISITIDPIERRGFEYHSDISFSIFSKNSGEELGRGGHYYIINNSIANHQKESAVGFTLNVNEIGRIYQITQDVKRIAVSPDATVDEICKLQKNGYITVQVFEDDIGNINNNNLQLIAENLNCEYIFSNNKITSL